MKVDKRVQRWLGGGGLLVLLVVIAGLYGGNDGGPASMGAFSMAFAAMVAFAALGGVGTFDPDIPHEWLKIELPRWAWVVVLLPYAGIALAMTWWTFSPSTPLDQIGR